MNRNYHPRQTDPRDIAAARAHAKRLREEREALDRDLIRRMEEGPMLDLEQIPWDNLDEHMHREKADKITHE